MLLTPLTTQTQAAKNVQHHLRAWAQVYMKSK